MTATTAPRCAPETPKAQVKALAVVQPRLRLAPFLVAAAAWLVTYLLAGPLSELLAYRLLGLERSSRLGAAVAFFTYEVPNVLLLLVAVVFVIGIANSYFTAERTRRILRGRRESVGNVLAALLGVVTPFCSYSAVPLFIGFVEAGIPLGVTFSFLVSAPMVNEVALVLLFGLFGWRIATLYLVTGLSIAILSGLVLGRLRMEQHIEVAGAAQRDPCARRESRRTLRARPRRRASRRLRFNPLGSEKSDRASKYRAGEPAKPAPRPGLDPADNHMHNQPRSAYDSTCHAGFPRS